jgi:hypothetical protein
MQEIGISLKDAKKAIFLVDLRPNSYKTQKKAIHCLNRLCRFVNLNR